MFAIIADGGRQYKVEEGQLLDVDYREAAKGSPIKFDQVLCIAGTSTPKIGKPTIMGASVEAEVIGVVQGDKLYIQKMRRRKNYRRRTGHRQMYMQVKISKIVGA